MVVRFNQKRSAATLQKLLDAATIPMDVETLAKVSGVSLGTAKKYSKHLREEGRMYVGDWDGQTQMLVTGPGKDVPYTRKPPTPKPSRALLAYLDRPVDKPKVLRVKTWATGSAVRDPLVTALFGEYRGATA